MWKILFDVVNVGKSSFMLIRTLTDC